MLKMIDRERRADAARLLSGYLAGEMAPGDFESSWQTVTSTSADPSLAPIGWLVWYTYDDLRDMERRHRAFTPPEREILERCIKFLDSDHPYDWDTPSRKSLERLLGDSGVVAVWPFSPTGE